MMTEDLYFIHTISNIISGISFFGVSYVMFLFVDKIKEQLLLYKNGNNLAFEIWKLLKQNESIFIILSIVFCFCGLGHLLEAFSWSHYFINIEQMPITVV